MELFPFLIFAILNLSGAYLWKYRRESNETWCIERQQSEIVQSAGTVTLLQVITELLPVLIFAIISLSTAYLLKYKRESNETWYINKVLSVKVWMQEA